MTLNQKIEISDFLKGILRSIEKSANDKKAYVSTPVFIFKKKEKIDLLENIITDLEREIHKEENAK